ncbi:hypothetical protein JCM10212_006178 [Sporobolomyces blumeae]
MSASPENQAKAEELKTQGNAAYKQREFARAIDLYQQAHAIVANPTYLNNLAAAYFEQGEYQHAIETCEKAVDDARDQRCDFKVIAKALGRIGSSYIRLGDYDQGIKYLHKSLTEHRTPDVLEKLKVAEKEKEEKERREYIDPDKAEKEREEGNKLFKAGDFAGSVKHYSESIKRNPDDPRGYTNRAAAYTKLMALPEALKDADKAIAVKPDFVKGYIRKSHVLFAMKDFTKALAAIEQAAEKDTAQAHTSEITSQMRKITFADAESRQGETDEQAYARAMRDPEVQEIMRDPVFQSILQQAQQDPKSLMSHMQDDRIRKKVEVLVRAGIIKTGRP